MAKRLNRKFSQREFEDICFTFTYSNQSNSHHSSVMIDFKDASIIIKSNGSNFLIFLKLDTVIIVVIFIHLRLVQIAPDGVNSEGEKPYS